MSAQPGADWRALVSFTTSDRGSYVRRCLPHLALACLTDARLDLLVALDGDDPETRALCVDWDVPLLYSDSREGVGLSKNRVVDQFPDYDYYFFLEDDVEIVDGSVFRRHVDLMRAGKIHHMSLFSRTEGRELVGESRVNGERIVHFMYGSAEFNAFTREGLATVGGWHPLFARYRRWGHTEHSWRFPTNALAPAPFNVAVDLSSTCIRHRPRSVTQWAGEVVLDEYGISQVERELMARRLAHVPLETIARYHLGDKPPGKAPALAATLAAGNRYPLLATPAERRDARADFLVWRASLQPHPIGRAARLALAATMSPRNIAVRHAVKTSLQAASQQFGAGDLRSMRALGSDEERR